MIFKIEQIVSGLMLDQTVLNSDAILYGYARETARKVAFDPRIAQYRNESQSVRITVTAEIMEEE